MVCLLLAVPVFAQDSCPDMQTLRKNLQAKNYLSLKFVQITYSDIFETVDTIQGDLWAGQKGRFRLTMPGQEVISNGELYWSYSEENKQVLLDSVAGLGDWNPVTLLYDPESIYECMDESPDSEQIDFNMAAKDTTTIPGRFMLEVSDPGYIPSRLSYRDENNSRIVIDIKDFKLVDSLPDTLFEYRPVPGVEIITVP